MIQRFPLWLPVPAVAQELGASKDAIYRDIRRGTFPFRTEVICGRIHVSARDLGLLPQDTEPRSGEAQPQDQSLTATA